MSTGEVLLIFAASFLGVAAFRPDGWVARWRRARRLASRVLIEDALKHVQESEYRGQPATLQSIAGSLSIPVNEAAALAARMEERGLVRALGEGLATTAAGREYALQVIRAHRLWERYLADQTGVAEAAWHVNAERAEHALTPSQADELAARLGHPRFDPHGDPIPTAEGGLPSLDVVGFPLSELPPDVDARIVHIEDEPTERYARLSALGFGVGTRVRTLDGAGDTLRVMADGDEVALPRLLAAGVTVTESSDTPEDAHEPSGKLSELSLGEEARIVGISRACRGLERRRLMDLGVVPGSTIEAVLRSPSGDPTAYRIRGTTIAIRRQQADRIRVRRPNAREEVAS